MSVHCLCMYQVVVVKPKGYHTGSNNVASNVLLHECLSACIQFWSSLAIIHTVGTYMYMYILLHIINPRRACAARVTVVGSVCLSVYLCVCPLSHISPMEHLFVLKTLSRTQRATKVKIFVGFSLKPLRCRDPALPPLYGHAYSRPFFHACSRVRACVFLVYIRA